MISDNSIASICQSVSACWPVQRWGSVRVVVGVSGGADSVCLLRTLAQLNPSGVRNLIVAHYDHRCRPASSEDADFVAALAASLDVPFERGCSHVGSHDRGEAALRNERYQFLESLAASKGARYVTVAHTRDDDVETILHNILRGTGGHGLRGIAPFRPLGSDLVLARPLLGVARSTIESALRAWDQPHREDPSNQSSVFTRNWLRGEVLPHLKSQFPEVEDALLRLSANVAELQDAIDVWAERLECKCVTYDRDFVSIKTFQEETLPSGVVVRLLQRVWDHERWPRGEMSQGHWQRIAALLRHRDRAQSDVRYHVPGKIFVDGGRLPDRLTLSKQG